jgi:hypothetical protein
MVELSDKWVAKLANVPESGMGYYVVTVVLNDGTRLDQVVIVDGRVTQIRGRNDAPFTDDQIRDIIVTHDKWDFDANR